MIGRIVLFAAGALVSTVAVCAKAAQKRKEQANLEILTGQNVVYPKVLICGATGVGKSSLINHILGADIAQTGSGGSVTQGVSEYYTDHAGLCFCECEGYTIDDIDTYRKRIKVFLRKSRVAAAWYCINAGTKRFLETDSENIQQLADLLGIENVHVILTKVDTVTSSELEDLKCVIGGTSPYCRPVLYSTDPALADKSKAAIISLIEELVRI